jgi:hypothetical protein
MAVGNTLAFCGRATIMGLKSFVTHAPDVFFERPGPNIIKLLTANVRNKLRCLSRMGLSTGIFFRTA